MSIQYKPWLVLAAIFIAGIATGCALTMMLGPRPFGPRDMRGHLMQTLIHRLHLTDDQRTKIEPIIAETAQKIEALHRNEMDQGAQIFRAADDKMAAILTPEQKEELKKMQSERERMFSRHQGPWRPMGPIGRLDDHGEPNGSGPGDMPPPPPPALDGGNSIPQSGPPPQKP